MSALDWLRNKATVRPIEYMIVTEEDSASTGTKPGKWKITRSVFKGRLPTKMVFQVKGEYAKLIKQFDGDIQINESIRLGGQYRSEFNNCEFFRTVYEFVA